MSKILISSRNFFVLSTEWIVTKDNDKHFTIWLIKDDELKIKKRCRTWPVCWYRREKSMERRNQRCCSIKILSLKSKSVHSSFVPSNNKTWKTINITFNILLGKLHFVCSNTLTWRIFIKRAQRSKIRLPKGKQSFVRSNGTRLSLIVKIFCQPWYSLDNLYRMKARS